MNDYLQSFKYIINYITINEDNINDNEDNRNSDNISDARRRVNTPTNDDNNDIITANINNYNNRNEDALRDSSSTTNIINALNAINNKTNIIIAGLKTDALRDTLRETDNIIYTPKAIDTTNTIKSKKNNKNITRQKND